ncbi:adenine nucleotide alpha hydrolases-like protein [Durotheca rogersii]|uniref:adenine nucleotide alpha hydrolases-like protein n=1 Tax=Durotheca rogersii TaxID=419775 RepID=UPI00221FB2BA|nr:adenine nucleotide alpha hydrolases-like protein [Durotheca rogersii]KAI5861787.1 adenine nucleotide alpha hydrolases-like protein [Durotheca rogersii]
MADHALNVVALISGGKDSFFSLLHCLVNGHRVVALANLCPPPSATDLNSFMYQTVGHQIIPLYAQATRLPLFRQAILGTAVDHGISYQGPSDDDETESLVPLLRTVLRTYPEINALCAGAILSTYQRTRIESVALRLGLVPLAYLWQYPELPPPRGSVPSSAASRAGAGTDDAQLLRDMAAAGLEARVVKVASAGLGEEFLWENVASDAGIAHAQRGMRRFGGGGRGSVLGEGGEFETLVVDGPASLFKARIVVADSAKKIVREGGGSAWLSIRRAVVETKPDVMPSSGDLIVRIPELLDPKFEGILETLRNHSEEASSAPPSLSTLKQRQVTESRGSLDWCFAGSSQNHGARLGGVGEQTARIADDIRQRLREHSLPETAITNSVIVLRRMADFPTVNGLYGALFREPNPPARVTISCGDLLLPRDADISIHLTVQPGLAVRPGDRRGLHVQSRSYWAPANIGPYSQAITFPLLSQGEGKEEDPALAVSIAGQIPLLPATMALPQPTSDSDSLQIVLALQHLWRIGAETRVRWWSSAVAYFPRSRSPTSDDTRHKALLAASAWSAANAAPSVEDEEEQDGPDPWDRKYNPLYMSFGNGDNDTATTKPKLPDWEVVRKADSGGGNGEQSQRSKDALPFVFAVEVEELPRSAGVEWHAHLGFANIGPGSTIAAFYHAGSAASSPDPSDAPLDLGAATNRASIAVRTSWDELLLLTRPGAAEPAKPKLTYVDLGSEHDGSRGGSGVLGSEAGGTALVPCRSLWDPRGRRLAMVSVFEARFAAAQEAE